MTVLIFVLGSLFHSTQFESNDQMDSYWYLHWIDIHRHFDGQQQTAVYSVEHIHFVALAVLIFISLFVTWVLAMALRYYRKHD